MGIKSLFICRFSSATKAVLSVMVIPQKSTDEYSMNSGKSYPTPAIRIIHPKHPGASYFIHGKNNGITRICPLPQPHLYRRINGESHPQSPEQDTRAMGIVFLIPIPHMCRWGALGWSQGGRIWWTRVNTVCDRYGKGMMRVESVCVRAVYFFYKKRVACR